MYSLKVTHLRLKRTLLGIVCASVAGVTAATLMANYTNSGVRRDGDTILISKSRFPLYRVIYAHQTEGGMDQLFVQRTFQGTVLVTDFDQDNDPDCVAVEEDGLEPREYCKGDKENAELYRRGIDEWFRYKIDMDLDRRVRAVLDGTSDEIDHAHVYKTR